MQHLIGPAGCRSGKVLSERRVGWQARLTASGRPRRARAHYWQAGPACQWAASPAAELEVDQIHWQSI